MKRITHVMLTTTLVAVLLVSTITTAFAAQLSVNETFNDELVIDFWESINSGDWEQWISFYPDAIQKSYSEFITPSNINANVGILTVEHIDVIEVVKVENEYAPKMYPELQVYYESEYSYECYKVTVSLSAKEDNGYFSTGTESYLTVLVKDEGKWCVGTICGCPEELKKPNEAIPYATGIGYGLITRTPAPTTISVMDEKGVIHSKENFVDFITNVTCNEIGNLNFNVNAIKAQIMVAKMCGWWANAGKYRISYGCDIKYGDVAYKSYYATNEATTATIRSYVTSLNGWAMVSSSATGGKLFFASYYAGGANDGGKGLGRLRQNGANYLANNFGYSWQSILHYYYDNSAYNNPNVGTVQIISGVQ